MSRRYSDIVSNRRELKNLLFTQVKYYSTGMQMRLGFAVATAIDPDILLLDGILAVGYAEF